MMARPPACSLPSYRGTLEVAFARPFSKVVGALLKAHPSVGNRLWLDVPEWSAFRYFDAFQELCATLRNLGCRVARVGTPIVSTRMQFIAFQNL